MAEKTLRDAFHETLKDVYYAEKQSVRALKKSAKAAKAPELKDAFLQHAEESANQVERLVQVFEILGKPAKGKTCEAMQGLTAEMEEDLEDFGGTEAADDVLIGCAQAIEHYEIARYGLLRTWALKLGLPEAAELLEQTLDEERRTDLLLTEIAEGFDARETDEGENETDEMPEEEEAAPERAAAGKKAKA
ncbi:ferritin-like domain-containing protein [Roseomonas chloroacetimidivorans]|jgi:ferritin-like metal-binding protein YciE|uniref:YciE/YciF ferroxidase family protein n=1 Tax=Roseomonas chloroacetimidivorans TaxID=1766656 RepID=UPI003C772EBA